MITMVNIANILLFFTNYLCVKYSILYYCIPHFFTLSSISHSVCSHCWSEPKYQQEEDAVPNQTVVRVAGAK